MANVMFTRIIKNRLENKKFRSYLKIISVIGLAVFSLYRYYSPTHIIITNFIIAMVYLAFQLSVSTSVFEKIKGYQAYYSTMILSVTTFSTRMVIIGIVFAIGLKNTILLPIALAPVYLLILFLKQKKWLFHFS